MSERRVFTVRARPVGEWWTFEVDGVDNAFGQAKRLDLIPDAARDVIVLMLDLDDDEADSFDIEVEPALPADVRSMLATHAKLQAMAAETHARLAETRDQLVRELRGSMHLPMRDVGQLLGVSHQRVAQLEKEADERARTTSSS